MGAMQLALFDYDALDMETRIVVKLRTSEIKALMRRTAQDIVEIGQKLVEVRGKLQDGAFSEWLRAEFDWSRRTAYNFITVAERFGSADFAQLDIAPSALYLLAAPSTPDEVREAAVEMARQGERVTHGRAAEMVREAGKPQATDGEQQQDHSIAFFDEPADGEEFAGNGLDWASERLRAMLDGESVDGGSQAAAGRQPSVQPTEEVGEWLGDESPDDSEAETPVVEVVARPVTGICPVCHVLPGWYRWQEHLGGDWHCGQCGAKVELEVRAAAEAPARLDKCRSCKGPLGPGARFCPNCGEVFGD